MKKIFAKAVFVKTAMQEEGYPLLLTPSHKKVPEIAVIGRSNVGKSSLLGHLFGTKSLVKVSSTPGKTQGINFFLLDNKLCLVDLPGYGFAKVPKALQQEWGGMIQTYLEKRESLQAILLLLDIRREPSEDDLTLLSFATHFKKPVILVLTKVDKLKREEIKRQTEVILGKVGRDFPFVHYSVPSNQGKDMLIGLIQKVVDVVK
jgi:GTP-binding protein